MEILILFMLGFYGLFVGEVAILIWFLVRLVDLRKGNTSFKVSWKIPAFYLGYSVLIGYVMFVLVDVQGAWGSDPLPMNEKLYNYVRLLVLANITTPLFPWMAILKDMAITRQTQSVDSNES